MPKKKPRIDSVRPEFPPVPGAFNRPHEPEKIDLPDKTESSNLFDRIRRIVVQQLLPFIRENVTVDVSVSLQNKEVRVLVTLFGKKLLERVVKIKV